MTFLLVREDREHLLGPGDRLESDLGILEVPEDVQPGDVVETHIGEEFVVRKPRGPDLFDHLDRTGAPMLPRDIGLVIGQLGLAAGDCVLDAGTGTGILAVYLGRLGIQVTTYEQDAEFAEVARENVATAGVGDRVEVRTGDVTGALDELVGRDFDGLTLDTADAPAVLEQAPELLAAGAPAAVYSPFVEAARDCVETARAAGLVEVECVETIQREMEFDERGSRPSTRGVGHTGYLTFARAPLR
ncbi:methyltransferase domain-containing protein [Halosegnis sp.]|uniref:methyltransferase domain-containing protein n=1 Tax=Halosegnis sp. TaxID=2864959 RepID=UPI0035D4A30A